MVPKLTMQTTVYKMGQGSKKKNSACKMQRYTVVFKIEVNM